MRNEGSGDEAVQKSAELACEVGQTIEVWEDDLKMLTDGDYDVLSEWRHIDIRGTKCSFRSRVRVRRVA